MKALQEIRLAFPCLLVLGLLYVNTRDTKADGFVTTSPMGFARNYHTATLLQNGNVLIVGGYDVQGGYPAEVDVFDSTNGIWTALGVGDLNVARSSHTATLLADGKVLVAGGNSASGFLASAELYDSATGAWTTTGQLNNAREFHTATLLSNKKVLIVGGYAGFGTNLAGAELYDPIAATWAPTAALNNARHSHTATLLPNGKVLVAGGFGSSNLSSAELYDPGTETWTPTGSMNNARGYHTATLLSNGKVLVAGGQNSSYVPAAEIYDPAAGGWTIAGALTTCRSEHSATLLPNGGVLIAGGYGGSFISSAEVYNPASGTWASAGELNIGRFRHSATLLPNEKVLIAGGAIGGLSLSSAELFIGGNGFNTGFMDFVTVGNLGNSNDPTTGYGAVAYQYSIGKYEVTLNQYTAFLKAVAVSDTYSLYNLAMATDLNSAGISRGGTSGSYTYAVIGDGNRPVAYVSWFDAARFANWLQNGRPSGAQTEVTTEAGAYTLNGATNGTNFYKNPTARYWIPSENEWYKGAYHQPASQGGHIDDYWLYPSASNDTPNSRNGSTTDANSANFFLEDGIVNGFNGGYAVNQTTGYSSNQNYLTPAGAFIQAKSFYGTFDQGGNVWEWNDAVNGATRGCRGGSAFLTGVNLRATNRSSNAPANEFSDVGFRLAATAAPQIVQQPQSQMVILSSNYTVDFFAVGVGPLAYQWLFNGAAISGGTNSSLTVSNSGFVNVGNYQVIITNGYGSVTSSVANLFITGSASTYAWTNFVGTPGTFGSADGTGSAAQFHSPYSVAVDGAGFSYVGDFINRTIRKVTPTGAVTVLAGTVGVTGTNDGMGTGAKFSSPWALGLDPNGAIFVADQESFVVRKVTAAGVVTTFAGMPNASGSTDGTGNAARFNYLNGLALDSAGNVFLSDLSHTIRKVTPAGVVTTIAGAIGVSASVDGSTNVARFIGPAGVAVAPNGDLYVADGNAIRVLNTTGSVTTIAGSAGISGSTDGVGTEARFNAPQGLKVDGLGNVYIADQPNHTLRRMTPDGVVTTIGGLAGVTGTTGGVGSAARFLYPTTVTMDSAGVLYVGDSGNHRISKGTPTSYQPVITTPLADQTVLSGSNATFFAGVSSGSPAAYQWLFNGTNLPGATGVLLTVSNAGIANVGGYQVIATNAYGSVTSSVATLTVIMPPTFTQQPTDQSTAPGCPYAFSAVAASAVPFTLQWWFANSPIAAATNNTYSASSAGATNAGSYWMVASNGAGASTSAVATLTVVVPTGAQPDFLQAFVSTPLTFSLTNLLANDSVNGTNPPASPPALAYMATSSSQGGTIAMGLLNGVPLWTNRYSGPMGQADLPSAMATDASGNVFVTGASFGAGGFNDFATIKYSSAGVALWTNRYDGPGSSFDGATAMAADGAGNVFVTGFSSAAGLFEDYATIKYSSTGAPLWTSRYTGSGNEVDHATAVAVDGSGNAFVTGYSTINGGTNEYATIKYSSTGVPTWTNRYVDGQAKSLALAGSGDVYVTGSSGGGSNGSDFVTIKYSNAGVPAWTNLYNGTGNASDTAISVVVDSSGDAYVAGSSTGSGAVLDYVTIKYSSPGVPVWTNRYAYPSGTIPAVKAVVVDGSAKVVVTGSQHHSCFTIAYSVTGLPLWTNFFDGIAQTSDVRAAAVTTDGDGNVFVTGYATAAVFSSTVSETIAYSGAGLPLWTNSYVGSGNFEDQPAAIAADVNGNIYVTGRSYGSGSSFDYATIKYGPTDPSRLVYTPPPGFLGTDSFTYVLTNTCGLAYTGVVIVAVGPTLNQITVVKLPGGAMQLSYYNAAGGAYALERTFSLSPPPIAWLPQVTNIAADNGAIVFTNTPVATTNNFWRIRSVP